MFETINDTIVSSDVAKLLKKRGFNKWCGQCYTTEVLHNGEPIDFDEECELKDEGRGDEIEYIDGGVLSIVGYCNKENSAAYAAPTQSVAMKWLREVHNIHIEVRYFPLPNIYRYVIIHTEFTRDNIDSHQQYFNSYEEACEAALKYTLETLIG